MAPDETMCVILRPRNRRGLKTYAAKAASSPQRGLDRAASAIDAASAATKLTPRLVAFEARFDEELHAGLAERLTVASEVVTPSLDSVLAEVGRSRLVITMRYHGAIAALLHQRPCVLLDYSPKMASLAGEGGGWAPVIDPQHLNADRLANASRRSAALVCTSISEGAGLAAVTPSGERHRTRRTPTTTAMTAPAEPTAQAQATGRGAPGAAGLRAPIAKILRVVYLVALLTACITLTVLRRDEILELLEGTRMLMLAAALLATLALIPLGARIWATGLRMLGRPTPLGVIMIATCRAVPARYVPVGLSFTIARVALLRAAGISLGRLTATAGLEMAIAVAVTLGFGTALLAASGGCAGRPGVDSRSAGLHWSRRLAGDRRPGVVMVRETPWRDRGDDMARLLAAAGSVKRLLDRGVRDLRSVSAGIPRGRHLSRHADRRCVHGGLGCRLPHGVRTARLRGCRAQPAGVAAQRTKRKAWPSRWCSADIDSCSSRGTCSPQRRRRSSPLVELGENLLRRTDLGYQTLASVTLGIPQERLHDGRVVMA